MKIETNSIESLSETSNPQKYSSPEELKIDDFINYSEFHEASRFHENIETLTNSTFGMVSAGANYFSNLNIDNGQYVMNKEFLPLANLRQLVIKYRSDFKKISSRLKAETGLDYSPVILKNMNKKILKSEIKQPKKHFADWEDELIVKLAHENSRDWKLIAESYFGNVNQVSIKNRFYFIQRQRKIEQKKAKKFIYNRSRTTTKKKVIPDIMLGTLVKDIDLSNFPGWQRLKIS